MTAPTAVRRRDRRPGGTRLPPLLLAALAALGLAVLTALSVAPGERSAFDASLPNPMGGPAQPAPGAVSGELQLAGLRISGAHVAMGDIALGVTYVPAWEVTNPTDREVLFTAGQPQVLEGCCPGPIYADGELTHAGQRIAVAPGGTVLVQFPLQMHRGMDGPHHLAVPLEADGERALVEVTGNFTAAASAS